jgi:O-antigen/teichoic acid export membrane protein
MQSFHVMRQAALMLTAVLLAKSPLSTEAIGEWELLLYVGYTLSFFWVSGLVQGALTMFPKLTEAEQRRFVYNLYLMFMSLSLLVLFLTTLGSGMLKWMLSNGRDIPYLWAYGIFLALHLPVFLLENLYLLHGKANKIWWFGLFSAVGQVVSIGIPVWIGEGILGGIYGLVIFAVIRHVLLLQFVLRHGESRIVFAQWRQLLRISYPLMGYSLLGGVQVAIGAWLVTYAFPGDTARFAIYRYGAQELPFAMALTNGFGTAMLPEIAKNLSAALEKIKQQTLRMFHLLFGLSIIIMLSSEYWFPWVFRDAFAESVPVFRIFLLIIVSRMVFSRTILVGLEANKPVWWIAVAELIIFVVLGMVLGSWYGLSGIALATLLSVSLEKVMLTVYLARRYGVSIGSYTDMRWFGLYVLLLGLAYGITF